MKYLILVSLVTISFLAKGQTVTRYIQVNGSADLMGNISITSVEMPTKNIKDTLVNYLALQKIVTDVKKPFLVFNELSKLGWKLVSSVFISKDDQGRPNSPFVAYYLSKDL